MDCGEKKRLGGKLKQKWKVIDSYNCTEIVVGNVVATPWMENGQHDQLSPQTHARGG